MRMMSSVAKKEICELVETLPEAELPAARRYLEFLREQAEDPVRRALDNAPIDDEDETPEEKAAVQEGREALARGEVVSDEELRRELGL